MESWHNPVQRLPNAGGIIFLQGLLEDLQLLSQLAGRNRRLPFDKDLAVLRLLNVPAGNQQLLVQLFAGPQPRLYNVNVPIRHIPGESDHIFRQIQNFYRLSHIQNKQLVLPGHGAGLQHQLCSFRNCHKITDNALVCYRDRSPRGDLPLKQRYYGAVGAQNISESNRHEISAAVSFHGLENHLAKPFAGAHYRGGIDRFVCGDQ